MDRLPWLDPQLVVEAIRDTVPKEFKIRMTLFAEPDGEFHIGFHDGPYAVEYALTPDPVVNLLRYERIPGLESDFVVCNSYPPDRIVEAVAEATVLNLARRAMDWLHDRAMRVLPKEEEDGAQN